MLLDLISFVICFNFFIFNNIYSLNQFHSFFDIRLTAQSPKIDWYFLVFYLYVSFVAPSVSPLVLADPKEVPVILFVVTPAHDPHGVSTDHTARRVLVYATLVVIKVLHNGQANSHWSTFVNFFLHFLDSCENFESASFAVVFLVIQVRVEASIRIPTFKLATLCLLHIRGAFEGGNAICSQKVNRRHDVAAVASEVFHVAVYHVLWRECLIEFSIGSHA